MAYLSRWTGVSGSGGDSARTAAAGSVVVLSAAAAASGGLSMVSVVAGRWWRGSDGWRAVPLN
jgi:hypothetical protein